MNGPAHIPLPSFYDKLDDTFAEAWRLFGRGVVDRRSPFHSPMIATIGLDGRPRSRVVILRGAERSAAILRFHTDRRSGKVAELAANPSIALTAYDAGAKVQVRVEGRAVVHTEGSVADAAWAASRSFSRVCYSVSPAPGDVIDEGGAFTLAQEEAEIAAGRANFSAVQIHVETLEWLYLAHAGHRRALFAARDGWAGRWLTP
jgi:pyridoxine/pyridoxamine 5'-phosphate oxidase